MPKRAMAMNVTIQERTSKLARSKTVITVSDSDDDDRTHTTSHPHMKQLNHGQEGAFECEESKPVMTIGSVVTCVPIPASQRVKDVNGNVRTHFTIDELEFQMDSQCPPECWCKEICQIKYPNRYFF